MIQKNLHGYEVFECSNCGTRVDEFDEYCQICGRTFQKNEEFEEELPLLHLVNKANKISHFSFENDWLHLEIPDFEKNIFYQQIPLLRIESYFNYLIRLLYKEIYKNNNISIDKDLILKQYSETCTKILKENAYIIINPEMNPYEEYYCSFEWTEPFIYYGKELGLIVNTIKDIVNYSPEIQKAIGLDSGENPYMSQRTNEFVQHLITTGYSIASNRIKDEIKSVQFCGIEKMQINDSEELVVYLTPKGMFNLPEYFTGLEKENVDKEFNLLLNRIGIQRINIPEFNEKYETKLIVSFENNLYYHYKQFNLSYNTFFNKRINRPALNSLIVETQLNLKKI